MRKFLLPFLLLVSLLLWSGQLVSANAQQTRQQAREAEWKSYALPKTNFTRKTDADKNIVFRVPVDWQQQGASLIFKGPNSATLQVLIYKVPDGYPLDDYFGASLKIVEDRTGGENSLVTRRTQFQDVEAREMVLDWPNPEGELVRRTAWIAINGPHAVGFNLVVPAAHAAEIEPYFKAIVQSVIFVSPSPQFEELRAAVTKSTTGSPIDEIENIVEQLSETTAQRDASITRLAAIFATQPEAAVDVLLDRRPLVRVAAVRAAAQSNNSLLTPVLWELLDDREPLVSEAAARGVANTPDVVAKTLERSMSGFETEKIARVWPYLTKEKRNELLGIILKEIAVRRETSLIAPPPRAKSRVSVRIGELAPVKPGSPPPPVTIASVALTDPNVQLGALTLLSTIPPDEFKMPFERIVASNNEPLIAVALQVALLRGEALPVASLLKLMTSSNNEVGRFAADNLATAAAVADVRLVEGLISKDGSRKQLDERLKLVIKKINFRGTLAAAKSEDEKRALIKNALNDAELAEFAWRQDCEASVTGCGSPVTASTNFSIKPLGENVFPQQLKHYSAIPNPRQTVQHFYESLHGLQLDSPRSQASLVLFLVGSRKLLAQSLSAPIDAGELIDYAGIDPDAPIALGSWTAPNARDSIAPAERKAIVLRVKDRARFERNVDTTQRLAGGFMRLTDIVGGASRAVAAVPALIPLTAQAVLADEPATPSTAPKKFPVLHYSFISDQEWNGFKLRVLENRSVENDWTITNEVTYIAYLGETAILAPDLASLREALTNAGGGTDRKLLADNSDFRQAIDGGGDVVYFSDLNAVFAEPADKNDARAKVRERGALKFSGSVWETSHHFVFAESDWAKPLLPFHPQELTAARELLPASTIGYFLTKVDLPALWLSSAKNVAPELTSLPALWTLDFQHEVLPELGPECGVVLTQLPEFTNFAGETWAAFCKLKSNKLADALIAGKLLRGVGPTTDVAEVKVGGDSYFVAARRGFLVVSNSAKVLASFDGKTSLATTRDYSRSVEKVPNGIVAFAGYNLESALAAATSGPAEGMRGQIANALLSLAGAFHSQNFYATASAGSVDAHSSVSMDREGRYAVADFSTLPRSTSVTYAVVEPHGVPITDQRRLSKLVLRLRAKAPGPIENIKDDIKSADQTVEQKSATELLVSVAARAAGAEKAVQLPVVNPEFAPYLKATTEFASDKKEVIDQARQIAGKDRDAWSVARKLAAWTNKNLEWKLTISANPVETLATREADCSEFSALFIAMARSLGLPARPVSGLAFNGNSFGGHAWVEVWAGRWIELDPTWGTSFVDATHIRNATNSLVTSAALNLIELEVVEAKREVAEFQKSPQALAEHLGRVIPLADKSEIEAAIDLSVLVDEHMGAGAWAKLSDSEREQMWSAYRRIVTEVLTYGKHEFGTPQLRLLHLEDKGDRAEASYVTQPGDLLLKLRLVRRDGVWHLVEIFQTDTSLHIAADMLQPAILRIEKARAGEKPPAMALSDLVRVLFLIDKEPAKASRLADEFLQTKPKDSDLRFLKAIALLNQEKTEDAVKLLTELGDEGFAPAVYRLAAHFAEAEDPIELQKVVALYQRYTSLEPHDPRGWRELAGTYEHAKQFADAAAAYRKAIEIDSANTNYYNDLIRLIVINNLDGDVRALLVAGEKHQAADDDLYGSIMQDFFFAEDVKAAEKFAVLEPLRMKTSALANVSFGELLLDAKRYVEAERLLNTAVQLSKKSAAAKKSKESDEDSAALKVSSSETGDPFAVDAYVALARLYRKQSRWLAALKAADAALTFGEKNAEAYYQRACALARLGRFDEAMTSLTRAIELFPSTAARLLTEPDLQPLSTRPVFKKLLPTKKEGQ